MFVEVSCLVVGLAAGAFILLKSQPKRRHSPDYATVVEKVDGVSIRRNVRSYHHPEHNEDVGTFLKIVEHGEVCVAQVDKKFSAALQWFENDQPNACKSMTFVELLKSAQLLGSSIVETLGLKTSERSVDKPVCVTVFCGSKPHFVEIALACSYYDLVFVSLYETLGKGSSEHILSQTESRLVACDSFERASIVLSCKAKNSAICIEHIVMMGDEEFPEDLAAEAAKLSVVLWKWSDFQAQSSSDNLHPFVKAKPDSVFTIQYTSGTTGLPKGVVLTQKNFVAGVTGLIDAIGTVVGDNYAATSYTDNLFLYLPMAHIYPLMMLGWYFYHGAAVTLSTNAKDPKKMNNEVLITKPSIFPMVPRTVNKMRDTIETARNSSLVNKITFAVAIAWKRLLFDHYQTITRDSWADRLVLKHYQRKILGGNVRLVSCGAAPINPEALDLFKLVFGCTVIEGYGMTEGGGATNICVAWRAGGVGHPVCSVEMRLADCPDLDIVAERDNKGELCFRGPSCMREYFKEPGKTAEAIDSDGWYHSGDIGEIQSHDGSIKITDRTKNIFKLAQGEYLAPEKIENVYVACPLVAQVFVDGDAHHIFTVAVVVLDDVVMAREYPDIRTKADRNTKQFRTTLINLMRETGKARSLTGLEQIRNVSVHDEPFSVANNLLTPTLKSKRPQLRSTFKHLISQMYDEGSII